MISGIVAGQLVSGGPPPSGFAAVVEADGPTWYCRHNEAQADTVAINRVGANGTYVGTKTMQAAAIYTGGLACWDTLGTSHCELPASVMPTVTQGFTLGLLLKRKDAGGLQALIDRDSESGIRKWQWRYNSTGLEGIKIQGSVQVVTHAGNATTGDVVLVHFRVSAAGVAHILKNGAEVATASPAFGVVEYGTPGLGLRIGRRIQGDSQANFYVAESMVYRSAISTERLLIHAEEAGLA